MQLELFPEPIEIKNERRIETILEKQERLRKKLFAENNLLKKDLKELKADLELIKSHICKGSLL